MKQKCTMVTKHYILVKAKDLKKKDFILLGGRGVTVVTTKKNNYDQVVIDFKYFRDGPKTGTLVVPKDFPFNPRRVERPKK